MLLSVVQASTEVVYTHPDSWLICKLWKTHKAETHLVVVLLRDAPTIGRTPFRSFKMAFTKLQHSIVGIDHTYHEYEMKIRIDTMRQWQTKRENNNIPIVSSNFQGSRPPRHWHIRYKHDHLNLDETVRVILVLHPRVDHENRASLHCHSLAFPQAR
jgi:hypothetical protein